MTVAIQTPEILQLINSAILNIVTLIQTFGVYAFFLSMIFLLLWFIWQIGVWIREKFEQIRN